MNTQSGSGSSQTYQAPVVTYLMQELAVLATQPMPWLVTAIKLVAYLDKQVQVIYKQAVKACKTCSVLNMLNSRWLQVLFQHSYNINKT